jgi:2-oxoisovalerate dehydrogenase E2 component (dihydrolipoyl transacylase)
MGIHVIKMPDIGEGIAEVELVEWHVQPGDAVVEDQVLADVMTDKATVEIPSPVHGKVISLGGKVGDVMGVGTELIRLEVEGAGNVAEGAPPVTGRAPAAAAASQAAPAVAAAAKPAADSAPAPSTSAPIAGVAVAPPTPSARPAGGRPTAAPVMRAPGEKPVASPAVRRRAWELGIELKFVPGSGEAGRILHEDLDAYIARGGTAAPAASRYVERHDEQQVQVMGLRRKIAQKMQEAKRRIPHFTYVEEIDVTELEALRGQLNAQHAAARGKLTLLPLLARAVVLAVRDFPQINARFDDDAGIVTRYGAVHLGIATQTDGGLMVPVLRHAEARDPWATAAEIQRLAEAARAGKAARDELTGSTITITSLGALGGIVTTPVINWPEVAIVGVGRIVERPVIRAGQVVARQLMNLSSSFDHRVVDGADGAHFVQALRRLLESPAMLFVD